MNEDSMDHTPAKKNVDCSGLDRISELPDNCIEKILAYLPMQDMGRSSVLSKKWRHRWADVPRLEFDNAFVSSVSERLGVIGEESNTIALLMKKVYEILLLHSGPIHKFTLCLMEKCPEIDRIISFLSKKHVQDLTLEFPNHKLPSIFFSFSELRSLNLKSCALQYRSDFSGFRRLVNLRLQDVYFPNGLCNFIRRCSFELERLEVENCGQISCLKVDASNLKSLEYYGYYESIRLNTPVLSSASILEGSPFGVPPKSSNLIDIFCSLPAIKFLEIDSYFLEAMASLGVPKRLPIPLSCLEVLKVSEMAFHKTEQVSSALCLIRSSPNLQKLHVEETVHGNCTRSCVPKLLDDEFSSECFLKQLEEVKLQFLGCEEVEIKFIKLLLARSPSLKLLHIHPSSTADKELKLLKEICKFDHVAPDVTISFPLIR